MFDPSNVRDVGVGGSLLTAFWLVLKYKPWERVNGQANGYDKKIAGHLVEIAKYAKDIGELQRDIKVLHALLFGENGQGGLAHEIYRLRTWQEKIDERVSRLEFKRRGSEN